MGASFITNLVGFVSGHYDRLGHRVRPEERYTVADLLVVFATFHMIDPLVEVR